MSTTKSEQHTTTQRAALPTLSALALSMGSMTKPRKTAKQWQWQTWFIWTPTMADMYGTNNGVLSVTVILFLGYL